MSSSRTLRVLVVAPFTHQNGHFVTLPRDVCCGLAAGGHNVTLLHTRPFADELDWFAMEVQRVCLKDLVADSPRWWRELWPRLAGRPSNQCLAWMIWKLKPAHYDIVLWTDFQAQANVWALRWATAAGLYRFRTAFFEHHPPEDEGRRQAKAPSWFDAGRTRVGRTPMIVLSSAHLEAWRARLGPEACIKQVPYGLWPAFCDEHARKVARAGLGLLEDAYVLLVFGVQAVRRKHLDTLLEAMSGFAPTRPMTLVFAGRTLHGTTHPFSGWSAPNVSVRFVDGFVPEELTTKLFAASDVVWANYRDFPGASGVLQQALGFGRLSLASSDGEIGRLCREHNLGPLVESGTPDAIRSCLGRLLSLRHADQIDWEARLRAIATQYSWVSVMAALASQLLDAPAVPLAAR